MIPSTPPTIIGRVDSLRKDPNLKDLRDLLTDISAEVDILLHIFGCICEPVNVHRQITQEVLNEFALIAKEESALTQEALNMACDIINSTLIPIIKKSTPENTNLNLTPIEHQQLIVYSLTVVNHLLASISNFRVIESQQPEVKIISFPKGLEA